ncbi:hypothetical protein FJT64_016470 [Amphibalanus amphitrite]|uniref:Uncharacterized protein n=1 Tax=Amphibalanus amphitrite TaxID=1232801 RepID=A0A6A4XED5_AMPAM|nr:hypothetical protein FJT64_016470 [Amphibalanus amphitrite]
MQTPIFRTEEPLWFLETAWCSQTQMGPSESTVWDLQSLMGARQMWTLGDAGMGALRDAGDEAISALIEALESEESVLARGDVDIVENAGLKLVVEGETV